MNSTTPTIVDWKRFKNKLTVNEPFREEVVNACVRYEVVKGITYSELNLKDISSSYYNHLPFDLLPAMINVKKYQNLCKVSKYMHKFIDGMSRDVEFLVEILKPILKDDPYLSRYLDIYEKQLKLNEFNQDISMGLYRMDYMQNSDLKWGQIEVNVAGVGGFFVAEKLNKFRHWLFHRYGGFDVPIFDSECKDEYESKLDNVADRCIFLPKVTTFECCVRTLATAARLVHPKKPTVLVLCPIDSDTGVVDQSAIDFELFTKHNVICVRRTVRDLCKDGRCFLDANTKELVVDKEYRISCVLHHNNQTSYTMEEFEEAGFEECMKVMENIEFSTAIKQNMGYTLMGTKIIQSLYSTPNIKNNILYRYLNKNEADLVLKHCYNVYCLDKRLNANADTIIEDARKNYNKYVLKPSRDGGGNNFFGENVKIQIEKILASKNPNLLKSYILMDKINAVSFDAWFVYLRQCSKMVKSNAEIGIFSCYLATKKKVYIDEVCGSYCKTKKASSNEGGLKRGNGVIDSCILLQ